MIRFIHPSRHYSKGSVLIISLILLLVLTLVVTSMLETISLEEKMAGNLRNHDLAFQAAEAALREGETILGSKSQTVISALSCNISLDSVDFRNDDWSNACLYTSGTLAKVAEAPRYYLEALDQVATSLLMGTGSSKCFFRITARGVGADSTAQTILQSTFVNLC